MDLGITGRVALVCASSRGLGKACAMALAAAGCRLVINGRDGDVLARTADEITRVTGASVVSVVADVSSEPGRAALLAAAPDPDILVNNNGGPPPMDFREVSSRALMAGLEANMIAPIRLVQAVVDGMVARRFGRIIDITSASVRMPIAGLDVSSGARAGLTAFLAGVAREVAHANVTINHILPGSFDTARLNGSMARMASLRGLSIEAMREERQRLIPAKRFGAADELGALCAFLASAHAGYITGQNVLIDGGAFPGAF